MAFATLFAFHRRGVDRQCSYWGQERDRISHSFHFELVCDAVMAELSSGGGDAGHSATRINGR